MSGTTKRPEAAEARRQHRNAWLWILAIGAAFIVVANLFGWWPWLIASVLSVLMVMFGMSVRDIEVSSDSKGDSVYYLGLLFTFIALIAALVAFDWGSDASRTIGIIRNFGIALVTTIVGLAGRVLYAMSGDAPGDLEEAIRGDLEAAVSEMKGSLDRARDQLDILVDTFADSGEAMATTLGRGSATVDRAAQTSGLLDEQTKRVAATAESLTEIMNAFHDAFEGGTRAARGLREALGGIEERSTSFGEQLTSAGADVRDFRSALAAARKAARPIAQAIREAADDVASVSAETGSLRDTISGLARRVQETDSAVEQIGGHAKEAGNHMQSMLGEAETHADRANRSVHGLAAKASALEETLASIRESAGNARDGIANVADGTRSVEEQLSTIQRRKVRLSESVDTAQRQSDELGSVLSGLRDQSGQLSQFVNTASEEVQQLSEETRETRKKIRAARESPGLLKRLRGVFRRRRDRVPDEEAR